MEHLPTVLSLRTRSCCCGTGRLSIERFEIDNRMSDHLQTNYSATYRTAEEYRRCSSPSAASISLRHENMFGEDCSLNKYPETRLRIYEFKLDGAGAVECLGSRRRAARSTGPRRKAPSAWWESRHGRRSSSAGFSIKRSRPRRTGISRACVLDINTKIPSRGRHLQLGETDPSSAIAATIARAGGNGCHGRRGRLQHGAHPLRPMGIGMRRFPVLDIIEETVRCAVESGAERVAPLVAASLAEARPVRTAGGSARVFRVIASAARSEPRQ